jgi:hypothetical protein
MTRCLSEPLGAEQCVSEIDEQQHCHGTGEGVVEGHGLGLSELLAERAIADGDEEEGEASRQQKEVEHRQSLQDDRAPYGRSRETAYFQRWGWTRYSTGGIKDRDAGPRILIKNL